MKELAEAEGKAERPAAEATGAAQKEEEKRPLKNPGANCRETRILTRPGQRRGKAKRLAAEARGAAQKEEENKPLKTLERPGANCMEPKSPRRPRQRRGKALETRRGANRSRANRGSRQ